MNDLRVVTVERWFYLKLTSVGIGQQSFSSIRHVEQDLMNKKNVHHTMGYCTDDSVDGLFIVSVLENHIRFLLNLWESPRVACWTTDRQMEVKTETSEVRDKKVSLLFTWRRVIYQTCSTVTINEKMMNHCDKYFLFSILSIGTSNPALTIEKET